MPPILNAQGLSKTYGTAPLFQNISFTITEGDRIGLIGPNGAGKSTLLEILAGRVDADTGEVAARKRAKLSYVLQDSQFASGETVRSVLKRALDATGVHEDDHGSRTAETLGRAGFEDLDVEAAALSGGWRKRLAIVEALVQKPDVLLLDEPTNHLDLAGIVWLENLLRGASFACVVVSHDRYFLENVATEVAELNRTYPDGLLRVKGNYSKFLEKKEEYLAAQAKHQDALQNRVHTEIEWLRRGPKARATKAKARIQNAHELIRELADINSRSRTSTAKLDFSSTERQTKRLLELEQVTFEIGGRKLFDKLDFVVTAGMRVGLVGPNGSGKTTMLRLMRGEVVPDSGKVLSAPSLRIVYFDQNRQLNPELTLRRALAPDSDSVIYQDRVVHVASWAARFLFTGEQLNQPCSKLSGGERARVLLAQLMLQPADVLLLDEPTNDLDIPTLEVLEETLLEYRGALVLVTHDRYLLDRVSTIVLGLDGQGQVEDFADYSQWELWQDERRQSAKVLPHAASRAKGQETAPATSKKKLSYLEAREFATIEDRVHAAEQVLQAKRDALEDPAIASDAARLVNAHAEMEVAQDTADKLYARWAELSEK